MLRIALAAGAVALCLASPAFAQGTMSGPSTASTMKAGDTTMTCNQMMAKAQSMSTHGSGAQMTMMQNQMNMAKQAMANKDDAGCKMHAQKAMDAMK
jgi:hypothetical protein